MKENMRFLQIKVYTRKFFRTQLKESIVSIGVAMLITFLVMLVTKKNFFVNYEGTKSGFFSLACACIWTGLFNSVQLVCREKNDIVKDELDKSLHASSYMSAHFAYQFALSFVQSIMIFIIFYINVSGAEHFEQNPIAYFLTIFLMVYSSDAMAFVISSAVPNPVTAMTVMPLVLLIQLIMAGVLFELSGITQVIAYFTVSRWGMSAFGMIGDIYNGIPTRSGSEYMPIMPRDISAYDKDADMYCGGGGEIFLSWFVLVVIVAVCFALSVFALKFTTKRLKK